MPPTNFFFRIGNIPVSDPDVKWAFTTLSKGKLELSAEEALRLLDQVPDNNLDEKDYRKLKENYFKNETRFTPRVFMKCVELVEIIKPPPMRTSLPDISPRDALSLLIYLSTGKIPSLPASPLPIRFSDKSTPPQTGYIFSLPSDQSAVVVFSDKRPTSDEFIISRGKIGPDGKAVYKFEISTDRKNVRLGPADYIMNDQPEEKLRREVVTIKKLPNNRILLQLNEAKNLAGTSLQDEEGVRLELLTEEKSTKLKGGKRGHLISPVILRKAEIDYKNLTTRGFKASSVQQKRNELPAAVRAYLWEFVKGEGNFKKP